MTVEIECINCKKVISALTKSPICMVCSSCGGGLWVNLPKGRITCPLCGTIKETRPGIVVPPHKCIKNKYCRTYCIEKDELVINKERKNPKEETEDGEGVSIVILCMNNLKHTKKCIESIRKNTTTPYQLVVLDNGSTDETLQYVQGVMTDKDVLIRLHKNIGFGPGNNLAVKVAKGKYICFLNNDCEVGEGWMEQLIKEAEKGNLVGGSLNFVEPDHEGKTFKHVGMRKTDWGYIEAWCLLIERKLFDAVGGFDERFVPALGEDVDLSLKVKELGVGLQTVPDLRVAHSGNKTTSKLSALSRLSEKNNALLYDKWIGVKEEVKEEIVSTHKVIYEKVILSEL